MNAEFDQYATEYSHLLNDPLRDRFTSDPVFFHRRKWMLIRDFFALRKVNPSNLRWLDVGCGQGELLRLAGGSFAQAVGCDPSSGMIQSCPGEELYQQPSPAELPFPDHSFDFVTAVCVYHHVHGGDRALLTKSIQRVLKPGGLFCLIEHNPWNPATRAIVKRCPVDSDAELLTASTAAKLVRSVDLEILETTYFLYFPENIFRRVSRVERSLRNWPLGGQYAVFGRNSNE
jgi:SAM-dependent methyltransferase